MYDELSVRNLWPTAKEQPEIMKYFPDTMPKGRFPDRDYFFNIMNTLNENYVQQLIKHANDVRHATD